MEEREREKERDIERKRDRERDRERNTEKDRNRDREIQMNKISPVITNLALKKPLSKPNENERTR